MKETYTQMKNRQQAEFNAFPIQFAFNDDQLADGMKALGLDPEETDKVIGIGFGGFVRRTDLDAFHEMQDRHSKELHDALMSEKNGKGFAYDAFLTELENHEYCITGDEMDAVCALGLGFDDIAKSRPLMKALSNAKIKAYHDY